MWGFGLWVNSLALHSWLEQSKTNKRQLLKEKLFSQKNQSTVCLLSEGCFVRVLVVANHTVLPGASISRALQLVYASWLWAASERFQLRNQIFCSWLPPACVLNCLVQLPRLFTMREALLHFLYPPFAVLVWQVASQGISFATGRVEI